MPTILTIGRYFLALWAVPTLLCWEIFWWWWKGYLQPLSRSVSWLHSWLGT